MEGEPDLKLYDESEVEDMFVVKKVDPYETPAKTYLWSLPVVVLHLLQNALYGYTFKLNEDFKTSSNHRRNGIYQGDEQQLCHCKWCFAGAWAWPWIHQRAY